MIPIRCIGLLPVDTLESGARASRRMLLMNRIIRSVLLIEVLGLEHGGDESIVLARTSLSVGSTTCIDNFGRPLLRRG